MGKGQKKRVFLCLLSAIVIVVSAWGTFISVRETAQGLVLSWRPNIIQ